MLSVETEFERIIDTSRGAPLAQSELRRLAPDFQWSPQASGTEIRADVAERLEKAWAAHVGKDVPEASADSELGAYEGEVRIRVVRHRRREQRVRAEKIAATLRETGRLVCQVPGCGFDFERVYGDMARGFAHVHHLTALGSLEAPRLTRLEDVAVVCANCHAAIHLGGKCRPLEGLIPTQWSTASADSG